MDTISQLELDIKELKIQGATNVALATLEGVELVLKTGVSSDIYTDTLHVAQRLAYARPTEPLAQNALRYIFVEKNKPSQFYIEKVQEYKTILQNAKEKIKNNDLDLIKDGGVYLTHCHSSTVVSLFVKAWKEGKRFSIYATETRPRYQGRTTVKELIDAGIEDVTLIIDNVATSILLEGRKHLDAAFIGADLLSSQGFVNKVGSIAIANATENIGIPLYCIAILLKYDPRPFSPNLIEQRSGEEIWKEAPSKLKFYAPAFDYVAYDKHIKILCEAGMLAGEQIKTMANSLYPFTAAGK